MLGGWGEGGEDGLDGGAGGHRGAVEGVDQADGLRVADLDGVGYVNDSTATNPHAAAASLAVFDSVVWVAGGWLKGADVEDLVRTHAGRLRAVVLLGHDRAVIGEALARHAPDVPVVQVVTGEDGGMQGAAVVEVTQDYDDEALGARVMTAVVAAARGLAKPGDTVLLAPAGASFDQFSGYADRGDTFAAAVRAAIR